MTDTDPNVRRVTADDSADGDISPETVEKLLAKWQPILDAIGPYEIGTNLHRKSFQLHIKWQDEIKIELTDQGMGAGGEFAWFMSHGPGFIEQLLLQLRRQFTQLERAAKIEAAARHMIELDLGDEDVLSEPEDILAELERRIGALGIAVVEGTEPADDEPGWVAAVRGLLG